MSEEQVVSIKELLNKAYELESAKQESSAEYQNIVRQISENDPINRTYVDKYATILFETAPEATKVDQAREIYEKALRYNFAQLEIWQSYLQFCTKNCFNNAALVRTVFERAIEKVGNHMKATQIWLDYIDFETSAFHMGFVNILCYTAAQTPLLGHQEIIEKYTGILDTCFDAIVEDQNQADFFEKQNLPSKYNETNQQLQKFIGGDARTMQQQLENHIRSEVSLVTQARISERQPYEAALAGILQKCEPLNVEKKAWCEYAAFERDQGELARAKLVYNSGLLRLDSDFSFWMQYVTFLIREMKDITSAKVIFEQKRVQLMNTATDTAQRAFLLDLMIENALFEEEMNSGQKARKIYEQLTTEIAPGHIKSTIAYVNFEKRMNNNEKAKELYYQAFSAALVKGDSQQVTYLAVQYSRFVAFNCNDSSRACDILNQATQAVRNSKVLYLSQINFLRHLQGFGQKTLGSKVVEECYEKALYESELCGEDKTDLGRSYLDFLRETCTSVSQIKQTEEKLRDANIYDSFSPQQHSGRYQESNGGSILGKRQRFE